MVGKFGDIIFETSDKRILSFNGFSQTITGRWSSHAIIGKKEKAEFNGPGKQKISFKLSINAVYGVRPRNMLDKLKEMIENGEINYLVIGGRPVGDNQFAITSMSASWDVIYSGGELAKATGTITLEEYA